MKFFAYIQNIISDIFIIWRNELRAVFKDPGVIIFFFVVPLIYPVLYGVIYNTEIVSEVPVVVIDHSNTSLSREFIRKIDGTADVSVYAYVSDMEEAKNLVSAKKAYGIIYIPDDFSININRGEQTTVSLFYDMSAMLYYKAILLTTTEASMEMRDVINVSSIDMPMPYEYVSIYNPQGGFASFLVPAILILVLQQTLLLGISMLAATNKERNPNHTLIPYKSSYKGVFRIVLGKALTYFSIYIFVSIWALVIVPALFNLPQIINYGTLLLFTLPYLLACIFFSMSISVLVKGRETPMMLFVFLSVPLLFLSGISWPEAAIPSFWKGFSYFFPSTFGIQGFVKMNTMGASLIDVAFEYQGLWLQTGVYFIITYMVYTYHFKRKEKLKGLKS